MSQLYIHSRKYHRYNRRLVTFIGLCLILCFGIVAIKIYFRYTGLAQADQTQISNNETALTGYISPYFMFKDSAKWIRDTADSTTNMVVYNQYVGGQPNRQLIVYINQTPGSTVLASTRLLTVKVVGGSLSAGSLSQPCSKLLAPGQKAVQEVTISGISMSCDPNPQDYSVILTTAGGNYQLKMSASKNTNNFIILYKDSSGHPDPNEVINIANSFKAI